MFAGYHSILVLTCERSEKTIEQIACSLKLDWELIRDNGEVFYEGVKPPLSHGNAAALCILIG